MSANHSSQISGYELDHGRKEVGTHTTKWYLRNGRSVTLSNEFEPTEWDPKTQTMGRRRMFRTFEDSSPSNDKEDKAKA